MSNYHPYVGQINPSHEGPNDANLLVLAESPWKTEIAAGRPLCGAAGNKINYWWYGVGIMRGAIRIENLYPYKPPAIELSSVPTKDLIPWMELIHDRIAAMPNLNLIVTLGNYATFALTGKGKVPASIQNHFKQGGVKVTEAEKKAGVTQLRGSIYQYVDWNGREIKVMPTIHPAAVLRRPAWEKRCIIDWHRAANEMTFPEYIHIPRNHIIDPTVGQVEEYLHETLKHQDELLTAVDIETWGKTLSCVGFANDPFNSITINTTSKEEKRIFLPYVKQLCECRTAKILCNGLYDWYWLDDYGIQLKNYRFDVQLAHHAIDPIDSHSLDYLASIFTRIPYWKDEAKDAEEIIKYAKKRDAVNVYNGLDCCATREIWSALVRRLHELNMWNFYEGHYADMLEPLLRTMRYGTKTDVEGQKAWAKQIKDELKEIRAELEAGAGENLFATKQRVVFREPTKEELDKLLLEGEIQFDKAGVPKGAYINREARSELIEQDLTYMIGGANAGKIKTHAEDDQKGFSGKKLLKFFYETLGLPTQKRRAPGAKKATVTLDEGALRKMNEKWPDKIGNYGNLLIRYRELSKELDYLKGSYSKHDHRTRTFYKMITKEGRLSSSKTPMYDGMNMQNIKR